VIPNAGGSGATGTIYKKVRQILRLEVRREPLTQKRNLFIPEVTKARNVTWVHEIKKSKIVY